MACSCLATAWWSMKRPSLEKAIPRAKHRTSRGCVPAPRYFAFLCCSLRAAYPRLTSSCVAPTCQCCVQVVEGDGRMLVIAVGEASEWGRTMALVVGESQDTPLQEKLTDLAAAIIKVGLSLSVLAFVVLMIRETLQRLRDILHGLCLMLRKGNASGCSTLT